MIMIVVIIFILNLMGRIQSLQTWVREWEWGPFRAHEFAGYSGHSAQSIICTFHHLLKGVIMTLTHRLLVPLSPCFRGCCSWCGLDFFPAAFLWDLVELTLVFSFTKYEFSLLSVPACLFGANWFWPVYPTASLLPLSLLINFCTREWARAVIKHKIKVS